MASGDTHDLIAWATTPVVLAGSYLLPQAYPWIPEFGNVAWSVGVGHLLGSLFLSPDLDLAQSDASQRWRLLKRFWKPYQLLVPHRSPLSHSAIFGTAIRLAYLLAPITLILQASGHWNEAMALLQRHSDLVVGLVVGVEIGAIVHLLTDGFYDGVVRPLKKIRSRR